MITIPFKSTQENWRKEYLGLKCNTVRIFTDLQDKRRDLLRDYIDGLVNIICVIIENVKTGETFSRQVTDVTAFENRIYIISWSEREAL